MLKVGEMSYFSWNMLWASRIDGDKDGNAGRPTQIKPARTMGYCESDHEIES
jgi:hypothetical protein